LIQRLAVLGLSVFSTLAIAQQTVPNNPSAPPQTATTTVQDSTDPPPMTKSEIKAQRKRQKQEEKSARAHAKAEKDHSDALKQDNKSTDAAEKARAPQ